MFHEILESAMIRLIRKDYFFGNLLVRLPRDITQHVPTAGVGYKRTSDLLPTLFINPDFFSKLGLVQQVEVLQHELMHLIYLHCDRNKEVDKKIWNIATDMCINEYLPSLHEWGITVAKVAKQLGVDMREKETSEYYLKFLLDNKDKMEGEGSEFGEGDDHSKWEEMTEIQKELLKQVIGKIASHSSTNHLPTSIQAQLEKLKNAQTQDWKNILRNYVGQVLSSKKEPSRKKINRRYGILVQGKKKIYDTQLCVCIDTSGSVPDSLIAMFFKEMDKMSDHVEGITVIECDSDVRQVYAYKKGMEIRIDGRGGTRYQPAIDKALKYQPDLIIMLGDGDSADEPRKPRCPVIWCNPASNPSNFGKYIKMVEKVSA